MAATIDIEKIPDLDKRVQHAGTEIVNAENDNSFRSETYDSDFCHVATPYGIVKLDTHGCLVIAKLTPNHCISVRVQLCGIFGR
jgi:hypothetical protein